MREIKFRAWLKNRKVMGKVLEIHFDKEITVYAMEDSIGKTWFEEDNENAVIMQYTGLKDKSDKEIYEGDIVWDNVSIVIVKFTDGEFSVDHKTLGGKWRNYGSLFDYIEDYEGEVIGNIYENPGLLIVEKNREEQ